MELGAEEPQICRLCGQCERIYIDVFGEEGTKRFLGVKIQSKINILIDETDPLPKVICVQCLGKLEFVCDFQEECLRTQQVLRDRYSLPPLTDIEEIKVEGIVPSTSTDNNNSIDKNLNSPSTENKTSDESEQQVVSCSSTKPQRNLRSQNTSKNVEETTKEKNNTETTIEQKTNSAQNSQPAEATPTRWLRRSRQTVESAATNNTEKTLENSIANRLRSHDSVASETNVHSSNNNTENGEKQNEKQQESSTIQIPTSALNKLLTIVSTSPNIEVAVKESRNRNSDAEDISFTVELCKKQVDEVSVVRARVFPDQGSCTVDAEIVNLLQSQSSAEVNNIINSIITNSTKGGSPVKLTDIAEIEQRIEASHNPEQLFRIEGEEVRVDDNVEAVVVNNQSGYACKLCRKFYERRDKCHVHVKTHLGIKQYACVLCNAKFVCKSDVMKHIRCSHTNPKPVQCPKCPKRFKSKFYLIEHDNVHKGVRPYSCPDCGQSYHHKVSLQIHMKSHLPPQNLACEYCGKVFPYRTRLLSHVTSVHLKNRRNFRCRFCYNLYSSLAVLNEHIKTRHATTYTCEICSKTFKVSAKYKSHVLQHSNPKPYVCNICNNRYASKAFLNEHLLKHEGLRKHICQKCGAKFAQASHLAAHQHVHGEKMHACSECGRKFNRRDNMKVHRKRHFEEKKTGNKQNDGNSNASNEKIEKDDGLPHTVCVRCLGTLEFLCDFHNSCHIVQEKLLARQNTVKQQFQREDDAESDKENTCPPSMESRHKVNILSPESINPGKSLTISNNAFCKMEKKEETVVLHNNVEILNGANFSSSSTDPNSNSSNNSTNMHEGTSSSFQTEKSSLTNGIVELSTQSTSSENQQSTADTKRKTRRITVSSLKLSKKNIESAENLLRCRRNVKRRRNVEIIATHRLDRPFHGKCQKQNDASTKEPNRLENNNAINKPLCEIGADQRNASFADKEIALVNQQIRCNSDSPSGNKRTRMKNGVEDLPDNKKSNNTNLTSIQSNFELKNAKTDEELLNARNEASISNTKSTEVKQLSNSCIENSLETEKSNETSTAVSVIVKKELDLEVSSSCVITNKFVWIPNDVLVQADQPMNNRIVFNTSPPSGDVAERNPENSSNVEISKIPSCDISSRSETEQSNEQVRSSVIKSNPINTVANVNGTEKVLPRSNVSRSQNKSKVHDEDDIETKEISKENESCDRRKTRNANFGRISDLLTDEQKEAVEMLYSVDMSVVDLNQVKKLINVENKGSYVCTICKLVYPRIDKCQVHIWTHLQIRPYKCNLCKFATVTLSNVRCHVRKSHLKIKPFACSYCGKCYVTAVLLDEHLNTHTGERPFKCELCNFASASRQVLSYHKTVHKPAKDVQCAVCNKMFFSKNRLRAHMIIHNKDKVVMCKLCSTYLSSAEALDAHNKKIHMQDYVCSICGKHLKSRKALHNHQNVHAEAKYKCSLCPNVYKSAHILKEHIWKHEGIRKYKCSVCEKTFAQKSHLSAHMAVHSDVRFHCPGCNRAYNRHDNMKIHTKRCKKFQANPELEKCITRKQRTKSVNSTSISDNLQEIVGDEKNATVEAASKPVFENDKTDVVDIYKSKYQNSKNSVPVRSEDEDIIQNEDESSSKDEVSSNDEYNNVNLGKKYEMDASISVVQKVLRPDNF